MTKRYSILDQHFEDHEEEGTAIAIILQDGEVGKVITIKEDRHDALRKFPGGRREPGETFRTALQREVLEEASTKIEVDPKQLFFLARVDRGSHVTCIYGTKISPEEKFPRVGRKGETVEAIPLDDVAVLQDFHPKYLEFIEVLRQRLIAGR